MFPSGGVEGGADLLGDFTFANVGLCLAADLLEDLDLEGLGAEQADGLTELPALVMAEGAGNVTLPAAFDGLLRSVASADGQPDVALAGGNTRQLIDDVHPIRTGLTLGLLHRCIIHLTCN